MPRRPACQTAYLFPELGSQHFKVWSSMYSRFDPEIQPRQSYMTAVSHLSLRTEMDQHALKVLTAKIAHAKSKRAECNGESPKEKELDDVVEAPEAPTPGEEKEAVQSPRATVASSDGGDEDSASVPGEPGSPSKVNSSALFDDDDDIEADLVLSRRSSVEVAAPASEATSPLPADVSKPRPLPDLHGLTDRPIVTPILL